MTEFCFSHSVRNTDMLTEAVIDPWGWMAVGLVPRTLEKQARAYSHGKCIQTFRTTALSS